MSRLAFLIPLLCAACSARTLAVPDVSAPTLSGSWAWVETSGGKMGSTVSPKSTGYDLGLTLGDNGRFAIRRGETVWAAGRFEASTTASGMTIAFSRDAPRQRSDERIALSWFAAASPEPLEVTFDARGDLVLDEGCCDRYKHIFRRIP